MRSTHTIVRSAGTSAVALFLIAGAALATSNAVGNRPDASAQPVSVDSASTEPTDELETEEPTDEVETAEPTDELETEEPTASAEDENENEDDDATEDATASPTESPEHEEASFDDHGGA